MLTYAEAMQQEQVAARAMIATLPHPKIGQVRVLGPAAKMSETPPSVRTAGPMLGQHSREVLTEIGYGDAQITDLLAAGIIAEPE